MKTSLGIGLRLLPACWLFITGSASAQNLVTNPSFNANLAAWNNLGGITSSWNSDDADGSGTSGSAQIVYPGAVNATGNGIYSNCIPVAAGTHYSFGAKFKVRSGQTTGPGAFATVLWYSSGSCFNFLANANTSTVTALDSWVAASVPDTVAPAGATSALLSLYAFQTTPGTTTVLADDAFLNGPATVCVADDNTLCLNGGRFKVTAHWRTHAGSGEGTAVPVTGDTGYFWFFSAGNVEVLVKVVNACVAPFNRYWVFAGGLTNVEVTLTVIDTNNGTLKTYVNPLDTVFVTIPDTDAFATCP